LSSYEFTALHDVTGFALVDEREEKGQLDTNRLWRRIDATE
jgi:hypothetical protein